MAAPSPQGPPHIPPSLLPTQKEQQQRIRELEGRLLEQVPKAVEHGYRDH